MVTGGGVLEFNWPALGSNLIYYLAFYFQYKTMLHLLSCNCFVVLISWVPFCLEVNYKSEADKCKQNKQTILFRILLYLSFVM